LGGNCAFDDFCINVDFFGIVDDVSVDVVDVCVFSFSFSFSEAEVDEVGGVKVVEVDKLVFSGAEMVEVKGVELVDEVEDVEVEIDEVWGAESKSIVSILDLS